ncbi:MAG TPA: acyltransferase [Chitinophagaceae bacterium]|jgi:peptidoglycan/LPS O-acetylase OafA/YrhL|nr:acyltransferase [Chitinophagaceae bacterium]
MKATTVTRSYYPALDGLRGFAILGVLLQHNFSFLPVPRFGWVGVDLFFVLSGFLITDILLKTKEQKNFLPNFYIRRMLRIFPLYYGSLILFFSLAPLISQFKDQYSYYSANQGMLWMHLQNWLYIAKPKLDNHTVFSHFWSLSVEEQFYLVWPLMILGCNKAKRLVVLIYVALLGSILFRFTTWSYLGNGDTNFLLQYMTRIDGLCVGSLIAVWRTNSEQAGTKKVVRLGITFISLHAVAFIASKTIFPGVPHFTIFGYSTIAVCFGLLLNFLMEKRNRLTKFLFENRPIKGLGKISYGVYIYHWPIFVLFKVFVADRILQMGLLENIIISIGATSLAVLVSTLSYNLFERKILALRDVLTTENLVKRLRQKLLPLYKSASIK